MNGAIDKVGIVLHLLGLAYRYPVSARYGIIRVPKILIEILQLGLLQRVAFHVAMLGHFQVLWVESDRTLLAGDVLLLIRHYLDLKFAFLKITIFKFLKLP